jgi:hypothetical protein
MISLSAMFVTALLCYSQLAMADDSCDTVGPGQCTVTVTGKYVIQGGGTIPLVPQCNLVRIMC